jgi:protein involved in polysaccharide export with SLBB domain
MGRRKVQVRLSILLILQLCLAVVIQGQVQTLVTSKPSSQTSQTGTGLGSAGMTAAKPGEADGVGNLQLGEVRHPLYRLNRSDLVAITFSLSPELNQIVRVQPDGYVMLQDAGAVYARGLTLEGFRLAVQKAYAGYLHDAQVAVALQDFEHPFFVAGGEVGHPGKYELRTDTNLMEAVQIAGGFTHEAKHSQVVLFRHVNEDLVEARIFNLKAMLKEKRLSEVPELHPGDMVFVPQNYISKMDRFLTKPALSMYVSSTQF